MANHAGEKPRCSCCAEPMALLDDAPHDRRLICAECRRHAPIFTSAHVAFDYAFPWDHVIQQLKFGGRTELARPLGLALTNSLRRATGRGGERQHQHAVDLVLPMPLSNARLAERGYNQALLIAQEVAQNLGLSLDSSLLLRPIETLHQAGLPREQRMRNLSGVFMVDPAARNRLAGRSVALVDDVITTGSTANEACRELLRAGALEVQVWAIARTAAH
jgi:ComF family protein